MQILDCLFEKVETFPDLQGSLQAINDGGFIEDFASPELTKIRHHIHQNELQIRQILQEMLKVIYWLITLLTVSVVEVFFQ